MGVKPDALFIPLNIAVLTVSDTREYANDTSGQLLISRLLEAGHTLSERNLLKDDLYKIRAQVANWIADDGIQVVLITGSSSTRATGRAISYRTSSQCKLAGRADELFTVDAGGGCHRTVADNGRGTVD